LGLPPWAATRRSSGGLPGVLAASPQRPWRARADPTILLAPLRNNSSSFRDSYSAKKTVCGSNGRITFIAAKQFGQIDGRAFADLAVVLQWPGLACSRPRFLSSSKNHMFAASLRQFIHLLLGIDHVEIQANQPPPPAVQW
jgi:hypothetical protein